MLFDLQNDYAQTKNLAGAVRYLSKKWLTSRQGFIGQRCSSWTMGELVSKKLMGRQKYINILIKPASSICNMQCRYCFNDVAMHRACKGKGIIDSATTSAVIDKALALSRLRSLHLPFKVENLPLVSASLKHLLKRLTKKKKGQEIRYSIQTNGLAIDRAWVNFFWQMPFL